LAECIPAEGEATVERSDGPRPCRNNPGWRSFPLSDAAVTMPRHAVIAVSLPVGLNTGLLAQGISIRSCEVPLQRPLKLSSMLWLRSSTLA
jgi:hypothetical protein